MDRPAIEDEGGSHYGSLRTRLDARSAATKGGAATGAVWVLHPLASRHTKAALSSGVALNAFYGVVVGRNYGVSLSFGLLTRPALTAPRAHGRRPARVPSAGRPASPPCGLTTSPAP